MRTILVLALLGAAVGLACSDNGSDRTDEEKALSNTAYLQVAIDLNSLYGKHNEGFTDGLELLSNGDVDQGVKRVRIAVEELRMDLDAWKAIDAPDRYEAFHEEMTEGLELAVDGAQAVADDPSSQDAIDEATRKTADGYQRMNDAIEEVRALPAGVD